MASINVAPFQAAAIPGQAGKILTILALGDGGSFTDEHEPLLERITFSTGQLDPSCQVPDSPIASRGVSRASGVRRWKWKNIAVILCLWIAFTLCNAAYSTINPFFPQIAEKKEVSAIFVGVIISSSPFCVLFFSPLFGYLLPRIGMWLLIFMGLLLVGTSYVSLAFMVMISSRSAFIVACVLMRLIEGVGTGMVSTVVFSSIPSLFPKSVGTLMGLFEVSAGFGYSLGPTLGGVMYQYGGYQVPFLTVGGAILLLVLPCTFIVRKLKVNNEKQKQSLPVKVIWKICTNLPFISLVVVVASSYNISAFFSATLPVFLENEFHQTPMLIGMIYFIIAATYFFSVLPVGPIIDKIGHGRCVTVLGLSIMVLAYCLIGVPYNLGLKNIWYFRVGFGIVAMGGAMTLIPVYSDLLSIGKRYLGPDDNMAALSSFMSGLIAAAGSVGLLLGPILGGTVTTFTSLPTSALLMAELLLCEALLIVGLSIIDKYRN